MRKRSISMGFCGIYLISINVIAFLLYGINTWLYKHTEKGQIDILLTIIALLGGSAGLLLYILLFDRKAVKDNMMSRVFIACIFVIQLIIFLISKGFVADHITLAFWKYFSDHKILLVYLAIINIVTLVAFALDKIAAAEHNVKSRIRIVTLLGLAFIGGSIGAIIGMYLFRHKTKKDYFKVGVPLIIVMQVIVLFYIMNAKIF